MVSVINFSYYYNTINIWAVRNDKRTWNSTLKHLFDVSCSKENTYLNFDVYVLKQTRVGCVRWVTFLKRKHCAQEFLHDSRMLSVVLHLV